MPLSRWLIFTLALAIFAPAAQAQEAAYLDTRLTPAERAHNLVGRMTLDEKANQLEDWATAIPRLAIPDYQTLMLPFLRLLGDGEEHRASDAVEELDDEFGLSLDERQQHLASGVQTVMRNRVGWACTYLKKAALIEEYLKQR